jgi:hypothetical protein
VRKDTLKACLRNAADDATSRLRRPPYFADDSNVERRLEQLEDRLAPQGRKHFLIVLTGASQKLTLDSDWCVKILRESGRLNTTNATCVVDLGYIPDDLNAAELEQYLREHGVMPSLLTTFRCKAVSQRTLEPKSSNRHYYCQRLTNPLLVNFSPFN